MSCLGGNWDPTDRKFSKVNAYRQELLPTCKAIFVNAYAFGSHKILKSAIVQRCTILIVLQEVQMLCDMAVR